MSMGLVLASNQAIIEARRGIAFAKHFSTDFSAELQGVGKTVAVPVFSGAATVYSETSGSVNDFETTDGSIVPVNVTLDTLVKVTYTVSQADLLELDRSATARNCGVAGGRAIGAKVEDLVMSKLTYAGRKAKMSGFTYAKIGEALALAQKNEMDPATCVVILEPETYGKLLDANVANAALAGDDIAGALGRKYGCKAVICSSKVAAATAAGTTTGGVGFVVPDAAVAIAGRAIEQAVDGLYAEYDVTTDEASGLPITAFVHGTPGRNKRFMNVACLLGAKLTYEESNSIGNGAPQFIQLAS